MASLIYDSFKTKITDGSIDLETDTIKVALVTSSYTADQDAHDFFDDVTTEVSGTGSTAGGASLANKAVTADNTDNEGVFADSRHLSSYSQHNPHKRWTARFGVQTQNSLRKRVRLGQHPRAVPACRFLGFGVRQPRAAFELELFGSTTPVFLPLSQLVGR